MTANLNSEDRWWRKLLRGGPDTWRLLLALSSGALAVQIGFVGVSTRVAEKLIIHGGYYFILAVFALFVALGMAYLLENKGIGFNTFTRPSLPSVTIAASSLFVLLSDPFGHKVLFDEYVLQTTAWHMHLTKEVGSVYRAYPLDGTFLPIDSFLDKRPYFFTFLVSLVHDLTGYRVANIFVVNALLVPIFLSLCFFFGNALGGRRGGVLSVVSMVTLPLLGQNATGAGMEMHNLTMLALTMCLGVIYLRTPDKRSLGLFCLSTVLLSQSRYESVIFAGPAALVIWAGWAKIGRPLVPALLIVTPLLFIPYAWHNRILSATPMLWQLQEGQSSRFSVEYLPGNLQGFWSFFFSTGKQVANSLFLSVCGYIGLAYLCVKAWFWSRCTVRRELSPAIWVMLAFGAGVATNLGMLQFYYWARLDDVIASRFALPSCYILSLCLVLAVKDLERYWKHSYRIAYCLAAAFLMTWTLPLMAQRLYTVQNMVAREVEWELSEVKSLPAKPRLILANKSTMPWVIEQIPSLILGVARQRGEQIRYHMEQGTFHEILVTQSIRPSSAEGDMGIATEDVLPKEFHLEVIAEKRFGGRIGRISRLVKVDQVPELKSADTGRN